MFWRLSWTKFIAKKGFTSLDLIRFRVTWRSNNVGMKFGSQLVSYFQDNNGVIRNCLKASFLKCVCLYGAYDRRGLVREISRMGGRLGAQWRWPVHQWCWSRFPLYVREVCGCLHALPRFSAVPVAAFLHYIQKRRIQFSTVYLLLCGLKSGAGLKYLRVEYTLIPIIPLLSLIEYRWRMK